MKKVPIYLVLFTFLVFMSAKAFSQGGFTVHAGTAIPLGDFADDDYENDEATGAALGFNMGGKYQFQLNEGGLGLYLAANLNFNGLKKNLKDDMKEGLGTDVDITFSKIFNIPVTGGLNYTYKANESISLFGELGLGVDFLKITSTKLEQGGEELKFNYKTKPQVAFELGGGLLFQDKYTFELHYCALGKHNGTGEMEYNGDTEEMDDLDINISLLTIAVGYKF